MNQLTVMLNNGNVATAAGAGQQPGSHTGGQSVPHYVFQNANQSGNMAGGQTMSFDGSNQLVAFQPTQQQQQPGTFLLNTAQPQGFALNQQHQGGTIQYFINPQHNQSVLASQQTQPTFGMLPNLITTQGPMNMLSMNQGMHNTNMIHPQQLMPNQQFVTMMPQPAPGNFQIAGTQLFQPQQPFPQQSFQIIGAPNSGTNGAIAGQPQLITNQNGQTQLIIPNQQFQQAQMQTNSQSGQQFYQLVLPNGQVVQTMQPQLSSNMLSQPTLHLQQPQAPTLTVPLQTNTNGQTTILAPNLSLPGQTFIAAGTQQANLHANMIGPSSTSAIYESVPSQQTVTSHLVLNSPSAQANPSGQLILNTSSSSGPTLLIPSVSSSSSLNSQSTSANTTAMVVLTQAASGSLNSINSSSTSLVMPSAVLDQKSLKSPSLVLNIKTEKPIFNTSKPSGNSKQEKQTSQSTQSSQTTETLTNQLIEERNEIASVNMSEKTSQIVSNPLAGDNSKSSQSNGSISNRFSPVGMANNETSTQTSIELDEKGIVIDEQVERPSRPLSESSTCSLKIAEEINDEDAQDQFDNETDDTETDTTEVNSDAIMSVESIVDNNDIITKEEEEEENNNSSVTSNSRPLPIKDDDDYKPKFDSPFNPNFTDTEDEEEEEEEEDEGEIRLVRKNGLTKAAYNLINNRILNSEDDNATTTSIDSRGSTLCEEIGNYDDKSNDQTSGKQKHTSLASSPVSMLSEGGGDSQSNTQNETILSSKCLISTILSTWPDTAEPPNGDGVNLKEIQDFAKSFKLCRIGLNLTQSQVGHELSQNVNGPCYSQSAICRFEKLDITPKSAKKIKPVLEQWMNDAKNRTAKREDPNTELTNKENSQITALYKMNGITKVGDEPTALTCEFGKKRKRRTSFKPDALEELTRLFDDEPHPDSREMTRIANKLNYDRDVVRVWFCNKRQAMRSKKPHLENGNSETSSGLSSSSTTKISSLALHSSSARPENVPFNSTSSSTLSERTSSPKLLPSNCTPETSKVTKTSVANVTYSSNSVNTNMKKQTSIYSIATMVNNSLPNNSPTSSRMINPIHSELTSKSLQAAANGFAAAAPISTFRSPLFSFQAMTGAVPPPNLNRFGGHYGSAFTQIHPFPSSIYHPHNFSKK